MVMSNNQNKEWGKDFCEFLGSSEIAPPATLSRKILERVAGDLNPSPWAVFSKLIVVVIVAGSLSLLICPQFGLGSYYSPLMHFFMQLGPIGCRAACGAFFMVTSVISACIILRPEELSVVRRTKFLTLSAVSGLGLGVFMCTSPEIILSAAVAWFLGASLGGWLSLELGVRARLYIIERRYA